MGEKLFSWQKVLGNELEKDYMQKIKSFLSEEINSGNTFFPNPKNIFKAFELCDFENLKVVILGQDPYHGVGEAHGLSFSVENGIKVPPSLKNIYKEMEEDLGIKKNPNNGNLEYLAKQGILLLNAVLTVKKDSPGSHKNIGWENFTDEIIKIISNEKENIIFILWGNFARNKKNLIDQNKHFIIESAHPSPFSARNGFFGSKPFSKTNEYLEKIGKNSINW